MNYKINQIKRLIESLNPYEIRELIDYLMEEVSINADINNLSIKEIAEKIENRELSETKELLMKADENGWSVAHELAYNSYKTNWKTDDKEILMLQDVNGWSVAHELAYNSYKTKWKTNDKEILMLKNNVNWSVAHWLADRHPTWTTDDEDILNLKNKKRETVRDILMRQDKL